MPHYNFAQEQALMARGRGLQAQAIRQGFAVLFRLPGRLANASSQRLAAANSKDDGREGHRTA